MTRAEAIEKLKRWKLEVDDEKAHAEYLEGWFYKDDEIAFDMAIEALKFQEVYDVTINAVNKYYDEHHAQILSWTPCSERLPEHTGFYLIQHSRECCADEMAVAFYSVEEHEIDPDDCWEFSSVGDVKEVIAWMPLPKPYTEE